MRKHLTHLFGKRGKALAFVTAMASAVMADTGDVVFSETFDDKTAFEAWTVVDANDNNRTWQYFKSKAAYLYDYQGGLDGDDWLISPEFTLDASKVYELTFYLGCGSPTKVENAKVYLGTGTTVESMTTLLATYESMPYTDNGDKTVKMYVQGNGAYRLGFYCYSGYTTGMRLELDNISVKEVSAANVPAAVTGLTLTPAPQGALSAELSFAAPTTTANGQPLEGGVDISICRNDGTEPVKTFQNVQAGASVVWTDDAPEQGTNTYTVTTSNANGTGESAKIADFIGVDAPTAVTNLKARLNSQRGVTLSWDAPTTSEHNGYVDYDNMSYIVFRGDTQLGDAVSQTTFTDATPVESGQEALTYSVKPVAGHVEGEAAQSGSVVTGIPLSLPYAESFKNQKTASPWSVDPDVCDFDWTLMPDDEDGEYEEITSQDRDNGILRAESRYAYQGEQSRYVSPLLDLSTVNIPTLKFYFHYARSTWYDADYEGEINDNLKIQVRFDAGEWQDVENGTFYLNDSTSRWTLCEVTLPQQTGSFAQIGLLATADAEGSAYRNIYVDNITVDEASYSCDLAVDGFTASQKRASVGETTTLTATIYNRGAQAVSDYQVNIYRDDTLVETLDGISVEPAKKADLTYATTATLDDAQSDTHQWQAEVVYAADELPGNNLSDVLTTSVRKPDVPAIDGLTGEMIHDYVSLSWPAASSVAPVAYGDTLTVTENWDGYDAFLISGFGDWTVYDGDGAETLSSPRIPLAYDHRGEPMAFQVFNNVLAGTWVEDNYDDPFEAYSGNQYLACPSVDYPYENDDWLISPRLDGRAQTVTFYAKSTTYDPEWINTWVSYTDNHHDSFTQVSADDHIALWNEFWKAYTIDVPEGARYFAIRCTRRCNFLFIDDVTYNAYNGQTDGLTLLGYNVYRDGEKLNATPVATPAYKDANVAENSEHAYTVTAVYEEGESDYSNAFTIQVVNGIATVSGSDAVEQARYNAAGQTLTAPARGLNIVRRADGTTQKVVIR